MYHTRYLPLWATHWLSPWLPAFVAFAPRNQLLIVISCLSHADFQSNLRALRRPWQVDYWCCGELFVMTSYYYSHYRSSIFYFVTKDPTFEICWRLTETNFFVVGCILKNTTIYYRNSKIPQSSKLRFYKILACKLYLSFWSVLS